MWAMIANHLWQSTLFAVLVGLTTLGFRNDGAHVRYWLWWVASVKFLVPFALLAAIGRAIAPAVPVRLVPETWSAATAKVAQPVADGSGLDSAGFALLVVWALGTLCVLAYWVVRMRRVRELRRRAEPATVATHAGARQVRVRYSTELVEPAIVGVLSPVLLLPAGLAEQLTAARLDAVIAHELCHARRRDNLTAAVHMLVEAAYWFHPLVWWIGARLIEERERACDQAVVRSGHDRAAYAEGILDVCARYARSPLRCAAGVSGADLQRRITQIMRGDVMSKLGFAKRLFLGTCAAVTLAAPDLAGFFAQSTALAQQTDDWLPIVKVAPVYPQRAAEIGLEGYVIVEYTVSESGSVVDPVVVESSSSLFEEAALSSVGKYKYQPRVVDGRPVAVPHVRTKISFVLEQDV
jgi:bla regulator protein BlaR1